MTQYHIALQQLARQRWPRRHYGPSTKTHLALHSSNNEQPETRLLHRNSVGSTNYFPGAPKSAANTSRHFERDKNDIPHCSTMRRRLLQGGSPGQDPRFCQLVFKSSTMLLVCLANSARFPAAPAELGRKLNGQIIINQAYGSTNLMNHPVQWDRRV